MKDQERDRLSEAIDALSSGREPSELDAETASLLKKLRYLYSAPTADESFKQSLEGRLLKELSDGRSRKHFTFRLFLFQVLSAIGITKGHGSWVFRRFALGASMVLILVVSSLSWYTLTSWRYPSAYGVLLKAQSALEALPPGKALYEKGRIYSALPGMTELRPITVERWVREPDRMTVARVYEKEENKAPRPAPKPVRTEVAERAEKKSAPEESLDLRPAARSQAAGAGGPTASDVSEELKMAAESSAFKEVPLQAKVATAPRDAAPTIEAQPKPEKAGMRPAPTEAPAFTFKDAVAEMLAVGKKNVEIVGRDKIGGREVIVIEWKQEPTVISRLYISVGSHIPIKMSRELVEKDGTRRIVRTEEIIDRKIVEISDIPEGLKAEPASGGAK
jgi:hypothetical protein